MSDPDWKQFERQVADLFRLRGFEARSNQIVAGRQHDIILTSTDESVPPILVECKFHEPAQQRHVGTDEVNDFAATVLRLRNSGDISSGYLVTNTDFTATARGAFAGRTEEKFIFLRTFAELRRGLINFEPYLLRHRQTYEQHGYHQSYEPLRFKRRADNAVQDATTALAGFASRSDAPLLVLTGDYGTGKTTACQYLQYALAGSVLEGKDVRIPLFVPLKWYGQSGGAVGLLQRFLQEEGLRHANVDSLLAMHAAGQLLIVFDGFDEMLRRSTIDSRRESIQDLADLCVPGSKMILTGRPGYFSDEIELRTPFHGVGITGARDRIRRLASDERKNAPMTWEQWDVLPLTPEQVHSFLIRKSPKPSLIARKRHATAIMKIVESTYNLADLATRPILLEMIAQTLAHGRVGKVTTPAALYGVYVDTWLRIDADKGAFRSLLSPEDRLAFSISLAWIFQDRNIQNIHWKELQSIVGEYFRLEEADDVDHFGSDVRTCTFLVRDDDGYYSFAHFSFQEYFCARFLIAEDEELEHLIESVLEDRTLTLRQIGETSPAILDFAGDLIGCPVNPEFWEEVSSILGEHPGIVTLRSPLAGDDSLRLMLAMSDGDSNILELREVGQTFREAYRALTDTVQGLSGRLGESWLVDLSRILKQRRL